MEGQVYKVLEVESKAGAAKMSEVVKSKLTTLLRDIFLFFGGWTCLYETAFGSPTFRSSRRDEQ